MLTFTPSTESITDVKADLLVLPVYEGPEAGPGVRDVGKAMGVDLLHAFNDQRLKGKRGEILTVPTLGTIAASTVLLVGVGKRGKVTADDLRRAAGKVAGAMNKVKRVATTLPQCVRNAEQAVQATVEGVLLGSYTFDGYKSSKGDKKENAPKLKDVVLVGKSADARRAKQAIARAEILASSIAFTRDIVNTPSLDATPEWVAAQARKMAKETGLKVKVWTPAELEKGGFGGILGVGRGSANPPRMVELSYSGGRASQKPVGLVGKGITFDSGGLSIKDAKNMEWMKADKSGAAAMLGAMRAIALLKPKINVVAAIPLAENMPGGKAIRPGDVLRHRNGATSEVLNTDAEGRLVLADALAFLAEKKPAAIIDAATLTGACMVALGDQLYGVFGNDDGLVREVLAAGKATGEPGWELPLWDGYRSMIDSPVADIKNIGGPYGGAITAALFLKEFVGDTPWVHLDVAGTAFAKSGTDTSPAGATGSPVRTVVRLITDRAAPKRR